MFKMWNHGESKRGGFKMKVTLREGKVDFRRENKGSKRESETCFLVAKSSSLNSLLFFTSLIPKNLFKSYSSPPPSKDFYLFAPPRIWDERKVTKKQSNLRFTRLVSSKVPWKMDKNRISIKDVFLFRKWKKEKNLSVKLLHKFRIKRIHIIY